MIKNLLPSKERLNKILTLGLPIIAGMMSQNIFNLVDTMMVGRLGPKELAAVGTAGMMVFTFTGFVFGVNSGVQAIAARLKGENKISEIAIALNNGLIFSFLSSIIITIVAIAISKPMFMILCNDADIAKLASDYFVIRMTVCVFAISNYAFRGYWNAIDKSKIYMSSLIIMNLLNILLNYLLIFGNFGFPRLGVNGSAVSTAIATVIGTIFYFFIAYKDSRQEGFLKKLPSLNEFLLLARISLISSSETVLTMINCAFMYWVTGQISSYALAGINILINMQLVVYLPAIALGITLGTLSGQALGRGDKEDAHRWGIDMLKVGIILSCMLALPYLLFPEQILRLFTDSQEVISASVNSTRIMGITLGLEVLAFIFLDALKSLGYVSTPMLMMTICWWLIFAPLISALVFYFHQGLFSIWV
ncbi:MAG: multidrug transporter, partial [Cyanobacteriota bacterium]